MGALLKLMRVYEASAMVVVLVVNREDVNWQASRRREQGSVNERECLREQRSMSNIFPSHFVNLFMHLRLGLWIRSK